MTYIRAIRVVRALTLALCASTAPSLAQDLFDDLETVPALRASAAVDVEEATAGSLSRFNGEKAFVFVETEAVDRNIELAVLMNDVFAVASGRDALGPAERYTVGAALARVASLATATLESEDVVPARDGGLLMDRADEDIADSLIGLTVLARPVGGALANAGPEILETAPDMAGLTIDNNHASPVPDLATVFAVVIDNRSSPVPLQAVQVEFAHMPASGPTGGVRQPDHRRDLPFNVAADGGDVGAAINAF